MVDLDNDFTSFPDDQWYLKRQESEYRTAAYVGNLGILAQNINDERLRLDRDGAASGVSAFSHSRDSGAGGRGRHAPGSSASAVGRGGKGKKGKGSELDCELVGRW